MSEVAVTEALGELLSPSQVTTYLTCPAKWYFRYLVGLSEPATAALALGKAFHGTLARNFRQKMITGRDMQTGELAEAFDAEWSDALSEAELRDDEDPAELANTGKTIVAAYLAEAAPSVKPRAVEQTVQGEIAGVAVRGIVDLLDITGCVFDFKTSSKRPNGLPAEHSLQLTTYTMITPQASGLCRLDTVTKTKTVNVVQQSFRVTACVRAPLTGVILTVEMTGRGDLTVALLGASLVAMVVTTLLGSEPIYETLKCRMIEQQTFEDKTVTQRTTALRAPSQPVIRSQRGATSESESYR
jgi:CRISPR/Cas system-associated exonuclease Cas4 (RecB family)